MAGALREEYAVEKGNLIKILAGARMTEFCYGEIFSLFFEQDFCSKRIPLALRIDARAGLGRKRNGQQK